MKIKQWVFRFNRWLVTRLFNLDKEDIYYILQISVKKDSIKKASPCKITVQHNGIFKEVEKIYIDSENMDVLFKYRDENPNVH